MDQTTPHKIQVKVNPADLEDISCGECKGKIFITTFALKLLPGVLSPDGNPGFIETPVAKICIKCNKSWIIQDILKSIKERSAPKSLIVTP